MICISVAPQSRTLAKVDLLNASRQGDMVELCLDHLIKDPDVGDLLCGIDKPVIVSCRRLADGGAYEGEEEHRVALLRQAIVAGPAYVELVLAHPTGVTEMTIAPEDFGIARLEMDALRGGDPSETATALERLLGGEPHPATEALAGYAAAARVVFGGGEPRKAADRCREALVSGAAGRKLSAWREAARARKSSRGAPSS